MILFAVFQKVWQIVRKRVAVPDEPLSDSQIGSDVTLETTPPAVDFLARQARQDIDSLAHGFKLFLFG